MDIRANLYNTKGHVMETMRQLGIRCRALASVPMGDCWWLWDVKIPEGTELPDGFTLEDLDRDTPYYKDGYFVEGMGGTASKMRDDLFWGDVK